MRKHISRLLKRRHTAELVIKRRMSSRTKLFLIGAGVIGVFVVAGWLFDFGLHSAGIVRDRSIVREQGLHEEIRRLKDDNAELRDTLARAQRTLQMDQVSYQELDRALKQSEKEIVKLREELSFYRNIISPANKVAGLQIQNLTVERTQTPGHFRYKLVLIQALKHERTLYGNAVLKVSGLLDGQETTITIPQAGERGMNVSLKYFQEFEGTMKFNRAFQPQRILVSVNAGGEMFEQNYSWPRL